MSILSYKEAGVDVKAADKAVLDIKSAVQSTYNGNVLGSIGGFGGFFDAAQLKSFDHPVLVSSTDGVGTKLELARRVSNLTGTLDAYAGLGYDLVGMCVNDIAVVGAKPLFFLDYIAIEQLDRAVIKVIVESIARACAEIDCPLIGGEMAEHPGAMLSGTFDLAGFAVGAVEKEQTLGAQLVQEGDVLLGLASSGFHSNGYSFVRRAFADKLSDAELITGTIPTEKLPDYAPKCHSAAAGESILYADALLAPTKLYVSEILSLLQHNLPIHAAAHITGGGISGNLPRVLPAGLQANINLGSWEVPRIMQVVQEETGLPLLEALQTFNMGLGVILVASSDKLAEMTKCLLPFGRVFKVGEVVKAQSKTATPVVKYLNREGNELG